MTEPKALFICQGGEILPDSLICSGVLGNEGPCEHSCNGRFPGVISLDEYASVDQGECGNLFPICGYQSLATLGHWQGHDKKPYPDELLDHKLFKCKKRIWLVVPGVIDEETSRTEAI